MGLVPLRGYKTREEAEAYQEGYQDAHLPEGLRCGITIIENYDVGLDGWWVYLD